MQRAADDLQTVLRPIVAGPPEGVPLRQLCQATGLPEGRTIALVEDAVAGGHVGWWRGRLVAVGGERAA